MLRKENQNAIEISLTTDSRLHFNVGLFSSKEEKMHTLNQAWEGWAPINRQIELEETFFPEINNLNAEICL